MSQTALTPEISVVVPLYNEAENVFPLAERVLAALGKHPGGMEVVLVDDASTDETWQRIIEAGRKDSRVRGLRHPKNQGQSAALWTGFMGSEGSIIATLDGDLQNDPADLPRLLAELSSSDMACGVRTHRADTTIRRISSKIARIARKSALGVDFADTGCNLRVFKRIVLPTMPVFKGVHRFMPILVHSGGGVVKEIPVTHHPRVAGVSKYGIGNRLGAGIRDLIMIGLFMKRQIKLLPKPNLGDTRTLAKEDKKVSS
jgi:dolichol-phosphate mannosyltransferase